MAKVKTVKARPTKVLVSKPSMKRKTEQLSLFE